MEKKAIQLNNNFKHSGNYKPNLEKKFESDTSNHTC